MFALARDGFGPKILGTVHRQTGAPRPAVLATVAIVGILVIALAAFGTATFDVYYWHATIAMLCMLAPYPLASMALGSPAKGRREMELDREGGAELTRRTAPPRWAWPGSYTTLLDATVSALSYRALT